MRRRLLITLSVFSLLTMAAFVVPLLDQRSAARTQQWFLSRSSDLDRFVALAALPDARDDLARSARRHTELYGEGVLVVGRDRRAVVASGLSERDADVPAAIDAALRNQPAVVPGRLSPLGADPVLLWRPVGTGTRADGAVLMRADPRRAVDDIATTWAAVLLGSLLAAVAFAALALGLARWVLRPVGALARGVGAVAGGQAGEQIRVSGGPAELRRLAEEFNRMSAAVRAGAEQQERLVADASHQIRNPLAALRLRVDGLDPHVGDGGRAAYDSALREVDRLERLLDGMLGLASAEATASAVAAGTDGVPVCDAGLVALGRVDAWSPAAGAAGVGLVADTASLSGGAEVDWPDSDLEQVLDVLIDNAIRHTGPGTTVQVSGASSTETVTIVVADDGPGLTDDELGRALERVWQGPGGGPGSSGLGLAIAERLITARAGEIELSRAGPVGLRVAVTLRRAR